MARSVRGFLVACLLLSALVLGACRDQPARSPVESAARGEQPQLLFYIGITMVSPILDIAAVIEQQEQCKISLTYGGSLHLQNSIRVNQQGDLYFPGEPVFLEPLLADGTVIETRTVGFNQGAILVPRGNPKKIEADLARFTDNRYAVVVGAEKSGSVGFMTKKVFDRLGIYEDVLKNAVYLTTDSKGLSRALRDGDADMVLNWRAAAFHRDNQGLFEVIDLDPSLAPREDLILGMLRYSRHQEIVRRFLDYAVSPAGQAIFRAHGFLD